MKFDHKVKHNGIWYEPFEEVPDSNGKKAYTKSEIARMPVDEL